MESSPSFKQALRIVFKRNIVRLALLLVLLAVWWVVIGVRGGDHYSITPHTLAKVTLSRVESPTRLLFSLPDPKEKKLVAVEILGLDSSGFSESLNRQCQARVTALSEGQPVWVRSAYVGSTQQTVGKVLVSRSGAVPGAAPDDIGLVLVREGCAFYCKKDERYLSSADQQQYVLAQEQARANRSGVWADASVKLPANCESTASK